MVGGTESFDGSRCSLSYVLSLAHRLHRLNSLAKLSKGSACREPDSARVKSAFGNGGPRGTRSSRRKGQQAVSGVDMVGLQCICGSKLQGESELEATPLRRILDGVQAGEQLAAMA